MLKWQNDLLFNGVWQCSNNEIYTINNGIHAVLVITTTTVLHKIYKVYFQCPCKPLKAMCERNLKIFGRDCSMQSLILATVQSGVGSPTSSVSQAHSTSKV